MVWTIETKDGYVLDWGSWWEMRESLPRLKKDWGKDIDIYYRKEGTF